MAERTVRPRKGSGGRPSKGDRYARTIRFPTDLYDAIERTAAEAGYSVNDFVVSLTARALEAGLAPAPADQERLPLTA